MYIRSYDLHSGGLKLLKIAQIKNIWFAIGDIEDGRVWSKI